LAFLLGLKNVEGFRINKKPHIPGEIWGPAFWLIDASLEGSTPGYLLMLMYPQAESKSRINLAGWHHHSFFMSRLPTDKFDR